MAGERRTSGRKRAENQAGGESAIRLAYGIESGENNENMVSQQMAWAAMA